MSEANYWDKVLHSRLSRRRALAGAATVGAGAAAIGIIGCGGGGGKEEGGAGTPGPAANIAAQDTTSQAKLGGLYRQSVATDPPNLDPNKESSFLTQGTASRVYSRLLKFQTGPGIPPLGKVEGDAAEKFEVSGDAMTWTFTLRKDMKFHPKGPASVNGRALDAEDVKASWDYFISTNPARATAASLVDKVEVTDKSTFVIKLKQPYAPFQELMAASSLFWIMSKQGATGELDTQKVEGAIGTGPWILDSQEKAVRVSYKRHPNWYVKAKISTGEVSLPLLDGHQFAIIPDPATQQSQFIAGNLDIYIPLNTNLVDVARQAGSAVNKTPQPPTSLLSFLYFNMNDTGNPFKDVRARRAISMAIDRNGLIDVFGNISQLATQGFDLAKGWSNSPVPWGDGLSFWWLDPEDEKAMGAAAQWYKYDVKEAKALWSAVGYNDSVDVNTTLNAYGDPFNTMFDAHLSLFSAIGIKAEVKVTDYNGYYKPEVYSAKRNYKGLAYGYQTPYGNVDQYLSEMIPPDASQNHSGFNDPALTDLVNKQRLEVDATKRQAIIYDIQRKMSDQMYYVPTVVGRWSQVTLLQPYVRNAAAFRTASYGGGTETDSHVWFDKA